MTQREPVACTKCGATFVQSPSKACANDYACNACTAARYRGWMSRRGDAAPASSKWHRLAGVDESTRTATCSRCGPVKVRRDRGRWRCGVAYRGSPSGEPAYRRRNHVKHKSKGRLRKRPYLAARGGCCAKCGFVPEHPCQLDVDHIDGNHANNDPANLQTLCANCHRLKTWMERHPGDAQTNKNGADPKVDAAA